MGKFKPADYGLEPEVLIEFIDEAQEQLALSINVCIESESSSLTDSQINELFRTVHTIKGNSAFLNLMNIKLLAHSLENLMNLVRVHALHFKGDVADVIISGLSELQEMLIRVRKNQPEVNNESYFHELTANVNAAFEAAKKQDTGAVWADIYKHLNHLESATNLDAMKDMLKELRRSVKLLKPEDDEISDQAKPAETARIRDLLASNQDPNSEYESEVVLELDTLLRSLQIQCSGENRRIMDDIIDAYDTMLPVTGCTPVLGDIILEKLNQLQAAGHQPEAEIQVQDTDSGNVKAEDKTGSDDAEIEKALAGKTIRVKEDDIDQFLEYVGDLIIINEMYDMIERRMQDELISNHITLEFRNNNKALENLSYKLQKGVLDIRKVPIRQLFQRAPRILRDIAKDEAKEIRIHSSGEDLFVDKSVLENLEAPFTHLLRNAVDHGIENPAQRIAAGKQSYGTIIISAIEEKENILIRISDDGQGINKEKLLQKAVER